MSEEITQKNYRTEKDSIGEIKVEERNHWGAQTQRSLINFDIGDQKMPYDVIRALIIIKICAAEVNFNSAVIGQDIFLKIKEAGEIILNDESYKKHFPLVVWQTGSGTQSNMNVNEVIASIANEKINGFKGGKIPIHPNDHVNKSQSSNDSFPTAMNIATIIASNKKLLPAMDKFYKSLLRKSQEWKNVIKVARTHMQDATPITLGQEFSGYASQIEFSIQRVKSAMQDLYFIAQGGTAVGTGLNAPKGFDLQIAQSIAQYTNLPFKTSSNKFEALASNDSLVQFSGTLNTLVVSLMKISNDIRILASGPRCGLNELILPMNEPGSSIMPGKNNPTQCEAMSMVCAWVMGAHSSVTIAGSNGHLELNVFRPMIIHNVLLSIDLLSDSMNAMVDHCIDKLKVNFRAIDLLKNNSLMNITALTPYIGYDKAAQIANLAYSQNLSLKDAALKLNILSEEEFEKYMILENMI